MICLIHFKHVFFFFIFREECSSRNGVNQGSCASGFGVCCVGKYFKNTSDTDRFFSCYFLISVTLGCGGVSSENNTYIVQAATTSAPATPCTYKICPCSNEICRIRYDFTTNVLASQAAATTSSEAADVTTNFRMGDCLTDQMSINSPGGIGSPIICGFNTGQHSMYYVVLQCGATNLSRN